MLTSIKKQMPNLNFTLTPSTVLIDFEIALRQSVQLQFPVASIKGCYFTLPSAYTVGYRLMDWRSTTGKTHPTLKLLSETVPH
jgi:hypothetical protein